MIQFYINNKPVPKAIARNLLQNAIPCQPEEASRLMDDMIKGDSMSIKKCSYYGVHGERRA